MGRSWAQRAKWPNTECWAGDEPWSARLEARGLDIPTLRPALPARVSAEATIDGRGFAPSAPWTARLAALSGTVLGRALTGRREIAHRDGSYDLRRVRIANGESHVDLDGQWGRTLDLSWNADVRTLALLHPDLTGRLTSAGRVRGTTARPQLEGMLRGHGLGYGGITVQSLQADADLDVTDTHESHVVVRAVSIDVGPTLLNAGRLELRGRAGQHGLELEFSSLGNVEQRLPAFEARLAVSGRYDAAPRSWHGSVDDASFRFPDGGASLVQPAAIDATAAG